MGGGGSKEFSQTKALCKAAIKGSESHKDKEEKVKEAFKSWDKDGNGKISKEEMTGLFTSLNEKISAKQVAQLVKAADKDKDGQLDFDEVCAYLFQAPHLQKFFVELEKLSAKQIKGAMDLSMKVMNNCDNPFEGMAKLQTEAEKLKEKNIAEMEKKLAPLLKKSIAWHDKDNSGVLEKDEAIIFFSNYVAFLEGSYIAIFKATILVTTDTMAKQLKKAGAPKDAITMMKEQLQVQFDQQEAAMTEALKVKWASYKADIEERHRAAWKVMDVNGDGNLNEAEILDCMMPSRGAKHQAFVEALGLLVGEADMGAAPQCDVGGECAQQ